MNIVCRRARESDRDALVALWVQAFRDPKEDIAHFLDTFDYVKTAFVLCKNERICSMLFLLPTAVQDGDHRFSAGYIYAGATDMEARGKGYYRRLLDYAAQTARQAGTAALLLRPATECLADSYRRMGFTVPLFGNAHSDRDSKPCKTMGAKCYGARRRECLSGQAFVDWDDRTIAYALSWCKAGADGTDLMLYDTDTVWERLPAAQQTETALLMPLIEDFQTSTPIWFGYGLE